MEDLGHEDVTLANRNRGSGTRLWLDKQLERMGIAPEQVRGYNQEARTPEIQSLLDYLQSRQYRRLVDSLGGYDTQHTGEELHP